MADELMEAAKEMLAAVNGMYIEFIDREQIVHAAESRLSRAVNELEYAAEHDCAVLPSSDPVETGGFQAGGVL